MLDQNVGKLLKDYTENSTISMCVGRVGFDARQPRLQGCTLPPTTSFCSPLDAKRRHATAIAIRRRRRRIFLSSPTPHPTVTPKILTCLTPRHHTSTAQGTHSPLTPPSPHHHLRYNYNTNTEMHFAGLGGVETCFTLFLHHAADLSKFEASVRSDGAEGSV